MRLSSRISSNRLMTSSLSIRNGESDRLEPQERHHTRYIGHDSMRKGVEEDSAATMEYKTAIAGVGTSAKRHCSSQRSRQRGVEASRQIGDSPKNGMQHVQKRKLTPSKGLESTENINEQYNAEER